MRPKVLIASSTEGLPIAKAIQVGLQTVASCTVWSQAFPVTENTIDTVIDNSSKNDFGVFVFSPDDGYVIRDERSVVTRDNVIFEAGLFVGTHGKNRAFVVVPNDVPDFHLPSDLRGVTTAKYESERAKTEPNAAVGVAVTLIEQATSFSDWTKEKLDIKTRASLAEKATYPLKLNFEVANHYNVAMVIESGSYEPHPMIPVAPNAKLTFGKHVPEFQVGKNREGKDMFARSVVVEAKGMARGWIPIDPDVGESTLRGALLKRQAGQWTLKRTLLDVVPRARKFRCEV